MDNHEVLNILDKSWSKQKLFEKIKKGESSEKIVQDFINENKSNFDILINLLNKTDNNILSSMEAIANCEINLINALRNKKNNSNIKIPENIKEINPIVKIYKEFQLSLFMQKWSNQFVIGILIMISIISLTKQAWA
tara:strand:+ start:813 stop:1223 length:411 start_codon:yes stop_codon:yes gene_type:complete